MYNDHPRDPKLVAVVDRWSLFRGSFILWKLKSGPRNSGRCRQAVVIRRWSLTQVWLYYVKFLLNLKLTLAKFFSSTWQPCSTSFADFVSKFGVGWRPSFNRLKHAQTTTTTTTETSTSTTYQTVLTITIQFLNLIDKKPFLQ